MKRIISFVFIIQLVFGPSLGMARITPKEGAKKILIKKGDCLWHLARIYFKDPTKWHKFKEYNEFTNPHLIYPGEELAIGYEEAKTLLDILRERKEIVQIDIEEKDRMIDEILSNIRGPVPKECEELIVLMRQKISDLEELLGKIKEEKVITDRKKQERELEIFRLLKEKDELLKEKDILNLAIDELSQKIKEKEEEIKVKNDEIKRLSLENKRLVKEKEKIKIFAYFLTTSCLISLILSMTASE